MDQLNDQFGRLLETVFSPAAVTNGGAWVPLADIEETDEGWVVEAELPSVRRQDINVELRENELIIAGDIKEQERKGVLRKRERRTGEFEYRVILPGQVDEEGIEANLHDGLLTVRVPKSAKTRPRKVEVKAA
jgi:HSP20 family protein